MFVSVYVDKQFSMFIPQVRLTSVCYILLWGFKLLSAFSSSCQWRQTLRRRLFDACRTTANSPGTLEMYRQSVIRRGRAAADYSGGGNFELFFVNCGLINDLNRTVKMQWGRMMSAVIIALHILWIYCGIVGLISTNYRNPRLYELLPSFYVKKSVTMLVKIF